MESNLVAVVVARKLTCQFGLQNGDLNRVSIYCSAVQLRCSSLDSTMWVLKDTDEGLAGNCNFEFLAKYISWIERSKCLSWASAQWSW